MRAGLLAGVGFGLAILICFLWCMPGRGCRCRRRSWMRLWRRRPEKRRLCLRADVFGGTQAVFERVKGVVDYGSGLRGRRGGDGYLRSGDHGNYRACGVGRGGV